jgi:hypothetical protein
MIKRYFPLFAVFVCLNINSQINSQLLVKKCWTVKFVNGLDKSFINVDCNNKDLKQFKFFNDGKMHQPQAVISPIDMGQSLNRTFRKWEIITNNQEIIIMPLLDSKYRRGVLYKIVKLDSTKMILRKIKPKF